MVRTDGGAVLKGRRGRRNGRGKLDNYLMRGGESHVLGETGSRSAGNIDQGTTLSIRLGESRERASQIAD